MTAKITGTLMTLALVGALAAPAARAEDAKAGAPPADACCPVGTAAMPAARRSWEEAVGLTAEQKRRVTEIEKQWREKARAAGKKQREAQAEAQRLMQAASPDMKRVRAALKRAAEAQADVQMAGAEAGAARLKALTAQQREALAKWQASSAGACGCGGGTSGKPAGSGGCGTASGGCGSAPAPAKSAGRQ